MKLEERIRSEIRKGTMKRPRKELQKVKKARIRDVLQALSRGTDDQVDAVFALLDNQTASWFSGAATRGLKICDGASTAHLACHVGILQRESGKLDREGRDYWLKPLWEIGALEKVSFDAEAKTFIDGHPTAKSPNSAYRIASSFLDILKASQDEWPRLLRNWAKEDATRARLRIQARLAETAKARAESRHESLIATACKEYAPRFLLGYEVLYVDAGDGARVKKRDQQNLRRAGLEIDLSDSMPDILLWNEESDSLWVIEAVCSDGEVDLHKVASLERFAMRYGKKSIGFTTAYCTWKEAAARQGKHKNIAPGTYIWIQEDGTKQFTVETFRSAPQSPDQ